MLGLLKPSSFRIWQHAALGKPIRSAADFAHAIGVELERIAKTIVVGRRGVSPKGVSPLGLGQIPLIVDESLFSHGTMLVGGGAIGVDIELDPRDLARVTHAKAASIAID